MLTAAGPASPSDQFPMGVGAPMQAPMSETFAKDAIISWFRGEFAAANAIIDALCNHLTQLEGLDGRGSEYETVFTAIHRRRLNWIPILHMQKYYSIADVALELKNVVTKKEMKREEEERKKNEEVKAELAEVEESTEGKDEIKVNGRESGEEFKESDGEGGSEVVEEDSARDDSSDRKITEEREGQLLMGKTQICSNHEDCGTRLDQIKMTKGFIAKEPVKGHMVNVVKGLKLYEEIFTDTELSKLIGFVNELRSAGRNGDLPGDTFILFNQQVKGNKRELIQLGVPIFGQIKEGAASKTQKSNIESIPSVLQAVIDHLVQWQLIPESRKPNSCIINFFDEGEYSQPYMKPPHLDQPISTLLLSESAMAFGRALVSDHHGNFKGSLMLSLKEGSLLVMRGNSADMAKHVICPSSNRRISVTFFKVRTGTNQIQSSKVPPLTKAMTLWQPGVPNPYKLPNEAFNRYDYEAPDVVPRWGVLGAPLVMLAPMPSMVISPTRIPRGGTGVFLPWAVGTKKYAKHLPPRAQRRQLLALPSPIETHITETSSDPGVKRVSITETSFKG